MNFQARILRIIPKRTSTLVAKRRPFSTASIQGKEAWLFVDSVFPIQLGRLDLRRYIGFFREEHLVTLLEQQLSSVKTHGFEIKAVEPEKKDGGVFVRFKYDDAGNQDAALNAIIIDLNQAAANQGGVPSWTGLNRGSIWLVKGAPWFEDLSRYASPLVKVAFEGPDLSEQSIYEMFRPYGRIKDIDMPQTVPAGTLRSSTIMYHRIRSATIARNVVHDFVHRPNPSDANTPPPRTRLRMAYQRPLQAHAIRDWISGHPRLVLPVVVFLIGTLTYTVFDPIRAFMVEGKMLNWFDYKEYALYKWLRANTYARLTFSSKDMRPASEEVWKERREAEGAMRNYLTDLPTTVAFVHGPQGSGKSSMLSTILKENDRKALVIDCRELQKASSDGQLAAALASQTGYWPIFSFLNSINNLIDLASVGLIGQKVGLSTSLPDQLQEILNVVTKGLTNVTSSHRAAIRRKVHKEHLKEELKLVELQRREQIRSGTWHDGRIDCIAGNGVMSELGIGDEPVVESDKEKRLLTPIDEIALVQLEGEKGTGVTDEDLERKQRGAEEIEAINSLPIVIIKNFASKGGKNEVLTVLAKWAASLAENKVAHVIFISDNRENAKVVAKAIPSKPLNQIALYDAEASSALEFVRQKLREAEIETNFSKSQTTAVEKLGGRAIDLESLIHKVRSGQEIEDVVEDIITRGVGELRKNAFGDDIEDSKSLPWSREQAWAIFRQLSKLDEIPYYDTLLEFPFKGDENALRELEHAELIAITTVNGRPSAIRPGKPVYKYVFDRLVKDPVFQATQELGYNEKAISGAENTVGSCERELQTLREIGGDASYWWGGRTASGLRISYLLEKMHTAQEKIELLEKKNGELKRILKKPPPLPIATM